MTSILSGFDTVAQALAAQQFALSIAQKNVANANNASYTRQIVDFSPGDDGDGMVSGVPNVSIQASRDRYIDYNISRELQLLGESSAASGALQQIDAAFNAGGNRDLQHALAEFFGSFSSLASSPENLTLRQQVLEKAENLSAEFRRLYGNIQRVQTFTNQAVHDTVKEINALTEKIALSNRKITAAMGANSEDVFVLRDGRQDLMEQLSLLVDVSYYETESGSFTVTTRQGGLLVLEDQSHALELVPSDAAPYSGVQLGGVDITSALESGRLGGLIKTQDKIFGYLKDLDDMAATLIDRVNEQHALGSDLNGQPGGDFFVPFIQVNPGSNLGTARTMTVALQDPTRIAAANLTSGPGNNDNAKLLAGILDEALFSSSSQTAGQFYASLIFRIGSDEKAAEENAATQNDILVQLRNQREARSGINLDEEAVNVIKYQKAFQASARFATILEALSDEVLKILG